MRLSGERRSRRSRRHSWLNERQKRSPRTSQKLAAIVLERDSLGGMLKTECGLITAAERLLPEPFQSRARLERLALKGVRTNLFEAVDHRTALLMTRSNKS